MHIKYPLAIESLREKTGYYFLYSVNSRLRKKIARDCDL